MKRIIITAIILAAFLITADSCKKDKEITCNLNAGSQVAGDLLSVIYSASASGDGVLSSISYSTDSGIVTISNPVLPWLKSVTISAGNTVSITGTGTVKDGTLEVKYDAGGGIQILEGIDNCSHSN